MASIFSLLFIEYFICIITFHLQEVLKFFRKFLFYVFCCFCFVVSLFSVRILMIIFLCYGKFQT